MPSYIERMWQDFQDFNARRLVPISDREVAFEALFNPFCSLQLLSEELRNDREIVLHAVTRHWKNLNFMHARFRSDAEIVLAGLHQHDNAWKVASFELKTDLDFVLKALEACPSVFKQFTTDRRSDRVVARKAVSLEWCNLSLVTDDLRDDPEIVLAAIKHYGRAVIYASERLRHDRDFALSAIIRGGSWQTLEELPIQLQIDDDFYVSVMTRAFRPVPSTLFLFKLGTHEKKRGWAAAVLARLQERETRAQRLWERVRILVFMRSVLFHWVGFVAMKKGKSEFENPEALQQLEGKTTMSGRDAQRLKRKFEEDFA